MGGRARIAGPGYLIRQLRLAHSSCASTTIVRQESHETWRIAPSASSRLPTREGSGRCISQAGRLRDHTRIKGEIRKAGVLIASRLESYARNRASELVKRLYGQRTSSHGGRYVYRRKGLLDEIPRVRLIRGVVIVRTEDVGKVTALLGERGADVHVRTVRLRDGNRAVLRT